MDSGINIITLTEDYHRMKRAGEKYDIGALETMRMKKSVDRKDSDNMQTPEF